MYIGCQNSRAQDNEKSHMRNTVIAEESWRAYLLGDFEVTLAELVQEKRNAVSDHGLLIGPITSMFFALGLLP